MSEGTYVGDFEIDPDTIPEAPKVPLGVPLVFEVVKGTRTVKDDTNGDGELQRFIWNDLQVKAIDLKDTPSLFVRLWVTERFEGPAHKSWKHFLRANNLPMTTHAETDLAGIKFIGKARKKTGDFEGVELSSVIGPA